MFEARRRPGASWGGARHARGERLRVLWSDRPLIVAPCVALRARRWQRGAAARRAAQRNDLRAAIGVIVGELATGSRGRTAAPRDAGAPFHCCPRRSPGDQYACLGSVQERMLLECFVCGLLWAIEQVAALSAACAVLRAAGGGRSHTRLPVGACTATAPRRTARRGRSAPGSAWLAAHGALDASGTSRRAAAAGRRREGQLDASRAAVLRRASAVPPATPRRDGG